MGSEYHCRVRRLENWEQLCEPFTEEVPMGWLVGWGGCERWARGQHEERQHALERITIRLVCLECKTDTKGWWKIGS